MSLLRCKYKSIDEHKGKVHQIQGESLFECYPGESLPEVWVESVASVVVWSFHLHCPIQFIHLPAHV